MNITTEEEDEEIEDFLNTSEHILDLHAQGNDISSEVTKLRLPRVRSPRVSFIYNELKSLTDQRNEFEETEVSLRPDSPRQESSIIRREESLRPVSPTGSHRCKCVHVILPKKNNDGLQVKDFVYLFICIIIAATVYFYLYNPAYYTRHPVY